jgi:hypothetical protein
MKLGATIVSQDGPFHTVKITNEHGEHAYVTSPPDLSYAEVNGFVQALIVHCNALSGANLRSADTLCRCGFAIGRGRCSVCGGP